MPSWKKLRVILKNRTLKHRVYWLSFGACALTSSLVMFKSGYYREGGPVEPWAVVPTLIMGIMLTAYGLFSKPKIEKEPQEEFTICSNCLTPFNKEQSAEGLCPDCNVPLEPLVGFYDRHPELKNKEDL